MPNRLLDHISDQRQLSFLQQLRLAIQLSAPAIVAQFSSIVMQFIDASMVGHLGADAAASIGLVSTSTWLLGGLTSAAAIGFSVQVAHALGASDREKARQVLRQGLVAATLFGLILMAIGTSVSPVLPRWLGGNDDICDDASTYFFVFSAFLPIFQLSFLGGSMLRCSGNMRTPSILSVGMCVMDVVFNYLLIFPTREISVGWMSVTMPGAGLGVLGAAIGTGLAETVTAILMLYALCFRSPDLAIARSHGSFRLQRQCMRKAARIGLPMGIEHAVMCLAQIFITVIVAPLGTAAIAANAFAITAESLCYMPGYGIADAATTLVGHSVGAGRRELVKSFSRITVWMGMVVMSVMGVIMYAAAPAILGIMTPVEEIRQLGVMALRIEAFAEPMFAASIVAYGVFVGAGDTILPCGMNLFSIWAVRITLAAFLAPSMGLRGVWIAMCIELCFRGAIFLVRLYTPGWMRKVVPAKA